MKNFLITTLLVLGLSNIASAATMTVDGYISITPGTAASTDNTNDVFGTQDGYTSANLTFDNSIDYFVTYLGKEAANINVFLTTSPLLTIFNTSTSTVSDKVTVSGSDIASLAFNGSESVQTTFPSANIFSFIIGDTLTLGFNDSGSGDGDFDDIVVSIQAVPVPSAALLFAPALLGFIGLRRKLK